MKSFLITKVLHKMHLCSIIIANTMVCVDFDANELIFV